MGPREQAGDCRLHTGADLLPAQRAHKAVEHLGDFYGYRRQFSMRLLGKKAQSAWQAHLALDPARRTVGRIKEMGVLIHSISPLVFSIWRCKARGRMLGPE